MAGSDGWVGNQHTDNCCCPILLNPLICIVLPSYPLNTPHTSCTVLPSSTQTTPSPDSIALNMHSGRPKLAHHPTNIPLQRQHLNTLHGHLALASCIIYHPIPDGSLTAQGISWFILIMSIIRPANAPASHAQCNALQGNIISNMVIYWIKIINRAFS